MDAGSKDEAKRLVEAAEWRMRDDVASEPENRQAGVFTEGVDTRKYEKAKKMFEEALKLDPGNPRAIRGVSDCNEMLRGYTPVQHIARVDSPMDTSILAPVDGGDGSWNVPAPPRKMPWEAMRERRRRDREGLTYTAAMFGKETEDADGKVDVMIAMAMERAQKDPGSARVIRDEIATEIEEFQLLLHRSWKGHGPEIRDTALAKLDAAFKTLQR